MSSPNAQDASKSVTDQHTEHQRSAGRMGFQDLGSGVQTRSLLSKGLVPISLGKAHVLCVPSRKVLGNFLSGPGHSWRGFGWPCVPGCSLPAEISFSSIHKGKAWAMSVAFVGEWQHSERMNTAKLGFQNYTHKGPWLVIREGTCFSSSLLATVSCVLVFLS